MRHLLLLSASIFAFGMPAQAQSTAGNSPKKPASKQPAPAQPQAEAAQPQDTFGGIDSARRMIDPLKITITKYFWAPVKDLPGSAHYIDKRAIDTQNVSDVNRLVRQVPGVNVVEEEGFGNKPNIGMRGGRIDRSADITLMEDGVLTAPAPYAAPQSYYFPRIERMEGIEVRKGASAIEFGPRTTNGALNLLSRSVPDVPSARANIAAGSYGGFRNSISGGTSSGQFGLLLEAHNEASDGFKETDFVGGDTGFNIQDYMGKLRYRTSSGSEMPQEFEFKVGYTEENSNETYLGLTSADFNANPYRRYAASQRDEFDAVHNLYQLSHSIEPMQGARLSTQLYRNDYTRTWDKLESVVIGGTRRSIATILNDPGANSSYLDILRGGTSAADALTSTEARREFYSQGIQTKFNYRMNTGALGHDITTGIRFHQDRYDRLHRDKNYQMVNGVMTLTSAGAFGTQTNRIGTADAWSGYALNRMSYGDFTVTPGLRYESIDLRTDNYGTSDPSRSGASLQVFKSKITALTPGVGMEYRLTPQWELIGGMHKGFAPPEPPTNSSAASNAQEEESINYELGTRFGDERYKADLVGFFTDYDNLLGADTFSSGGGGGDQFNGGKVHVYGLEAALGYDASGITGLEKHKLRVPVLFNYTFIDSSFRSSFNSSFGEWGNVQKGFELPYLPRHQFYTSVAIEHDDWSVSIGGKYMGSMRTVAGRGPLLEERSTDANFIVDLNAEMRLIGDVRGYVSVNNLFDDEYMAARRPAGVRPGAPQMIYGGLKAEF